MNENLIDPELARILAGIPKGPHGIFDYTDVAGTRDAIRLMSEQGRQALPAHPDVAISEHTARHAGMSVSFRLLRPANEDVVPGVLWFHGGGQMFGSSAQDDQLLIGLVRAAGCAVMSIDYRLAPEHRAPQGAEDGAFVFNWVRAHADKLRIDAERLGIAGASGGGGVAAAAVLILRTQGVKPLFQALSYPQIDYRNITESSHRVPPIGVFDRESNIIAWDAVLGSIDREAVTPFQSAALEQNLADLPQTFIAVAGVDVLRDEGIDYATRLVAAGVPVDLHLFGGAYHAWDLFGPTTRLGRQYLDLWRSFITRMFELSEP